jgi:hypothetical protein
MPKIMDGNHFYQAVLPPRLSYPTANIRYPSGYQYPAASIYRNKKTSMTNLQPVTLSCRYDAAKRRVHLLPVLMPPFCLSSW